MILYVLRHGIAEDAAPGGDDRARQLTPRGREKMRKAATGMRALGLEIEVLLTSPLVRAVETAAIVGDAYGGSPAPQELPALAQGVPPVETVRALRSFARYDHVMIVGHEPGLSQTIALLLTGSTESVALDLKKGGLVAVEVDPAHTRSRGTLRWMVTPRQLRRIGR